MFSSNTSAVSGDAVYIEDVFSTYLYTGTGASQTINNGIDLAGKGGLVWTKVRDSATYGHVLTSNANGWLESNSTAADAAPSYKGSGFLSNGFNTISAFGDFVNWTGHTFASWTFRKQPKFFDVVTFTTNGSGNATVSHALGSTPGCIFIKSTTNGTTSDGRWYVYHRMANGGSSPGNYYLILNTTDVTNNAGATWITPSATDFQISGAAGVLLASTAYVAYIFAHDAGGFGLTGTDNVISCGSFTTNAGGVATAPINLGYEPQWVMIKQSSGGGGDWRISDVMRGASQTNSVSLWANLSDAEVNYSGMQIVTPTATGFNAQSLNGLETYIYIAIRRGPMKTPTSGTSVFAPVTYTGTGATRSLTAGFPIDLALFKYRSGSSNSFEWFDRLRGTSPDLRSAYTFAELATTTEVTSFASNTQVSVGASSDTGGTNVSGYTYVLEALQRAPGFFDVVCFTSTGSSTQAINHNLGVTPELIIEKVRNNTSDWAVQQIPANKYGSVNSTSAMSSWSSTGIAAPTATVFSPAGFPAGRTEVAYLFASCPGVSKVGSYTGDGTVDRVIDCGFTSGARFILLKKTSTTSGWYVYDTARGISSSGEASLLLNSTAAESGVADVIDPASVGFSVGTSSSDFFNESGVSYIFLAIA